MERESFLLSQDYIQFHGKCHKISCEGSFSPFFMKFSNEQHIVNQVPRTRCRKHILPACGLVQQVSHFRISHVILNFEFVGSLRFISMTVYRFYIHSTFYPLSLQQNCCIFLTSLFHESMVTGPLRACDVLINHTNTPLKKKF